MKDTTIKNTGNSRFLRSSVAEDITFAEFIALLRAGQLPIDLAGINEEGIETLGMPLRKSTLLDDETEAIIWGSTGDRKPTEALKAIFASVSEKAKVVTGTYTGNTESLTDVTTAKTITLGFQPKAVIVFANTVGAYGTEHAALALLGYPFATDKLVLTTTGFQVRNYYYGGNFTGGPQLNRKSYSYFYIAITY